LGSVYFNSEKECNLVFGYVRLALFFGHITMGRVRIRCNEITDGLVRGDSGLRFPGPEPALGVSRHDLQKNLVHWLVNWHGAQWRGLGNTQRQA